MAFLDQARTQMTPNKPRSSGNKYLHYVTPPLHPYIYIFISNRPPVATSPRQLTCMAHPARIMRVFWGPIARGVQKERVS